MNFGVLGLVTELERASGVTGLAAGFASSFFPQAFGLGLFGAVTGGRTRTVPAVLRGGVAEWLRRPTGMLALATGVVGGLALVLLGRAGGVRRGLVRGVIALRVGAVGWRTYRLDTVTRR